MDNRTQTAIKKLRYKRKEVKEIKINGKYKKLKSNGRIIERIKQSGTKWRKDKEEKVFVYFTVKIFHNPLL